jgi:hypothetical protein
MFVDIWLGTKERKFYFQWIIFSVGKEIDPNGLYNPKPSSNSTAIMNENTGSNMTQSRPFAQSVRGHPTIVTQQSVAGTMKSTKTQVDNRRGNSK